MMPIKNKIQKHIRAIIYHSLCQKLNINHRISMISIKNDANICQNRLDVIFLASICSSFVYVIKPFLQILNQYQMLEKVLIIVMTHHKFIQKIL